MELTLFVDHQCNLRCSYCYNGEKYNRAMSLDTMREAVDLVLRTPMRLLELSFFGGEPLVQEDLVREAMLYAERRVAELPAPRPELRFILNTNATLIRDTTIGLLSNRRCLVFVSVDGPRDVHDRFRVDAGGKGSYDKTLAGIARLRAAKIPFQIMVVFGAETAGRLGDAIGAALPLGSERIQLSANYRDDWTDESIADLRRGLDHAGDVWMDLFRAGQAFPIVPFHSKILSHLKGGIPCPSRCLLGGNELTVTPTGRLYPCPQMVGEDRDDALVIGHVATGVDTAAIAALERQKARSADTCAPCELVDRCQSQCGCRHVALTGRLGEITATLCEIESAFIDAADRVAETMMAEQNVTFIDYFYRREWRPADGAQIVNLRRSRGG